MKSCNILDVTQHPYETDYKVDNNQEDKQKSTVSFAEMEQKPHQ